MVNYAIFSFLILALVAGCSSGHQATRADGQRNSADLIVLNARVWTGDRSQHNRSTPSRLDASKGLCEPTAFAIRDGRFVYVGDDRGAERWRGPDTRTIDAAGARVIPGMIDAHMHLISGGQHLSRLDLRRATDRPEFIAAVAERATQLPAGQWIRGGRWSTESWPDPAQPTRAWIDAVTPNHPVFLSRMDGHSALANTVALRLAGIDQDGPPDPPGGKIDRAPSSNEPTGILKEAAMDLVWRLAPVDSPAEMARALAAATEEAHGHGITTVHTMSSWARLEAIVRARDDNTLTLRVRLYVSEDDWTEYIDRVKRFRNDDRLRVPGFKQFMDGSLGSRTAYMAKPFADNPPDKAERRGLLTATATKEDEMLRLCGAADAAGLASAIHAIGDQANHRVLDIYEAVIKANGPRADRRLRIEHAQHLLPGDIPRFSGLGVVASMQPLHKADDGRYAEKAIGPKRCKTSYAYRSLLDAGARVAFGSDWPVVTLNPFKGIHAAVTGKTLDGKTFVPEQNITVEEALRAYTGGGAYAASDQDRLGQIKPGFLADFVVLGEDLFGVAPDVLGDIRVRATFVNGKRVWPTE